MREIKFRAWNDGTMSTMPIETNYGISRFFGYIQDDPDAIVMQYTGLKDKNGVEIYEGDFDVGRWFDGVDWHSTKGPVVFENSMFIVDDKSRTNKMPIAHLENEIIGNILENPELLP
jgi:uncharacterized phage protein (TIGR01671 family)